MERHDDKIRAEGVAINDYTSLFVEKGTVIHATRDFKALNLKEILEQHQVENPERYIAPSSSVGGWGKFIKTNIKKEPKTNNRVQAYRAAEKKVTPQLKKNGRGWLHK
jgi:hypothetical protein